MKNKIALFCILVVLCIDWLYEGSVRADSDSDSSSSSSSGEHKYKYGKKKNKNKYNYPAYPSPYEYNPYLNPYPQNNYNPYPYNQFMPPYQPNSYSPYPYNQFMPPYTPHQGTSAPSAGPNPSWNYNGPPNQQPAVSPGQAPQTQPASSIINHSLKVNKEYNEDGHHTS
ncbi:metacaspase-1 [Drosophila miranda]|uniref:metacaspase-1 n=1 Tax=Drosophila miranda TaxID=7229 RepID=UPI00143F7DD1|nr:metacaspase-1 [Drosophila miranda]